MKMSEYQLPKWCEICGDARNTVKRVYKPVALQFKGDGFTKSVKEDS